LNGLKPVSLINCWKPASPGWIFVNMNWPNGEAFAAVTLAPAITWAFETVKVSRSILLLWALAVVGATARTTAVENRRAFRSVGIQIPLKANSRLART